MTWDMLREMQSAGMTIGGHTVTHPVLANLDEERQRDEIQGCKARIEMELRQTMTLFSYPVGGKTSFNATTQRYLREAGVRYAFSYYGGVSGFKGLNCLDVRRVAVERETTLRELEAVVALPRVFA
jgi:peptidoglycan/xylan/chitin deacetylase (PgdA/CDA1 family)